MHYLDSLPSLQPVITSHLSVWSLQTQLESDLSSLQASVVNLTSTLQASVENLTSNLHASVENLTSTQQASVVNLTSTLDKIQADNLQQANQTNQSWELLQQVRQAIYMMATAVSDAYVHVYGTSSPTHPNLHVHCIHMSQYECRTACGCVNMCKLVSTHPG